MISLPQLVLKSIYGTTTGNDWICFWFLIEVFIIFCNCRSQPVNSFEWGNDTVISLRFNPGEPNVLATSGRYAIYDLLCVCKIYNDIIVILKLIEGYYFHFLNLWPNLNTFCKFRDLLYMKNGNIWKSTNFRPSFPSKKSQFLWRSDRSITIYDLRTSSPARKLIMRVCKQYGTLTFHHLIFLILTFFLLKFLIFMYHAFSD